MKENKIKEKNIEEVAKDITGVMENRLSKISEVLNLDLNEDVIKTIDNLDRKSVV